MKKLLCLAVLFPVTAFAQIFPLHQYASAVRDSGQEIRFLRNPEGITYVGTCKGSGEDKLCGLAKDGNYKTTSGVSFTVKEHRLLVDGETCDYVGNKEQGKLDCKGN